MVRCASRLGALLVCAAMAVPGARADDLGPDDDLSGRDIYERYVEQRSKQSFQKLRIISRDPGGSEQLSRFELRLQDARDENGEPTGGVRFRTRIDVNDPFDLRHTKYLIITKDPGPDDEFVYQPSARRVRRVDLGSTSFLGTDYTFDDFTIQKVDEAEYTRHPDEEIEGRPVYVVETRPHESVDTQYAKTVVYLDKEHYVPLRIRSWDTYGVELKEMTAPASTLREFDGVWVVTESTTRDLRQQTSSTLIIDELDASPRFNRGTFSSGRLTRGN